MVSCHVGPKEDPLEEALHLSHQDFSLPETLLTAQDHRDTAKSISHYSDQAGSEEGWDLSGSQWLTPRLVQWLQDAIGDLQSLSSAVLGRLALVLG